MKLLAKNNKAFFDYDVKETFDAGLVLSGPEVKSVKNGNVSMAGSYVKIGPSGASVVNCHIGPYKYAPSETYNPTQSRKLLLNKQELKRLLGLEKGFTVVPLEIYETGRSLVKIKIGVGRGRKKTDKREYIKKRDTKREIRKYTDS